MSAILDFRLLEVGGKKGRKEGEGRFSRWSARFSWDGCRLTQFSRLWFSRWERSSLFFRLLIRHLIRTRKFHGCPTKKDVYKISHDFKINTMANKNTHFTLISPVDIKISYFCVLGVR